MAKSKVKKNKLKTLKGALKRFKVTGSGKVRFRRANRSHYNTSRTTKQMRDARANGVACKSDEVMIKRMLNVEGV
ncbi:MAG: 50S ribosomal protein L35 [Legionellales bacterium]|nr:50S ribosomal protein L35 [Legionellales bacterium]|tara:strand:- start:1417 stop:1641 length:225 start_codon:yes stop_codon:yes gene_type:complete